MTKNKAFDEICTMHILAGLTLGAALFNPSGKLFISITLMVAAFLFEGKAAWVQMKYFPEIKEKGGAA